MHNGSLHARKNNFDFPAPYLAAPLVLLVHSYPLTRRRPDLSWHLIEAPAMKFEQRLSLAPEPSLVPPKTLVE